MIQPRLRATAAVAVGSLLTAGLAALSVSTAPSAIAAGTVTVTDDFSGSSLDPRWSVVGADPSALSVSGGALRITGQRGDTYQGTNDAKNIVMLDVPAGDFTATATLAAPVSKVYQGAGLIAWQDIDNYVRSGLTFVGGLSPSGVAIENDVESGAAFRANAFTDRPASQAETLRLQRVGNTITTSYLAADGSTWTPAGSVTVSFATTQVGMYALGAQDGTTLAAAFDSITVTHAEPPAPSSATLAIDGDGTGVDISDDMFGIFYEDINYAADGGLYAEQVRNRSFEFSTADNGSFNATTAWSAVGGATLTPVSDPTYALDPATNRTHLRLTSTAAGQGVRNAGYDAGIALAQGATYEGYLWARTPTPQTLTVNLEGPGGVVGTAAVPITGDTWTKYPFTLTSSATTDAGRLTVLTGAASVVGLDMVSLMPSDRWVGPVNGKSVLRKDLAEKIASMHPRFVRFPGGCVTNVGDSFATYADSGERRRTYQWKETIGPVEKRPTNFNFWGYNQSYGIGYQEYFDFAEDLGAAPLPVVSVGANGCGGRADREMKVGDANFDRWVQDTVDLVEFANGPATSGWGKVRAQLGHPAPYGLKYLGLGNEENTTTFEANFPAFRDAVKAKFPEIQIISNAGPDSSGSRFDTLWKYNRQQNVDLVDEHYYRDPSWFYANNRRYDSYPRTGPKVFLGEYASRGNNLANALSEASYMTALQRNADVVRLASYAPLLANENHIQWNPDAIWFDNDQSWARPPWHVQSMFGNDPGDETVPSTLTGGGNTAAPIDGGVFLSTWNTAADYDNVKVTDNTTGATLLSDDFTSGASQWSPTAGSWSAIDGVYRQSSTTQTDARSIVSGAYTKGWKDYTLELDATKKAGQEGFLIGFGAKATNDYYWYNLGGFNNTRSLLERSTAAGKTEVAAPAVAGGTQSVETGKTYRVKIVVAGTKVSIYLDGVEQFSYDSAVLSETTYQVVTRDEAAGTITAKVVNNSAVPTATRIVTSDVALAPTAQVVTLSGNPSDTNTKSDPDRIAPVRSSVDGVSNDFTYTFPKYSVTFVTMKVTGALPSTTPTTPPGTTPTAPSTTPTTPGTPAPVTTVSAPGKVKQGKRPEVSVSVPGATGAVSVVVTRTVTKVVRGKKKRRTTTVLATQLPLTAGVASLRLPRLKRGRYTVAAVYSTGATSSGDRAVIKVKPKAAGRARR